MLAPPILPANLDALLRLISNGLVYRIPVRGATTACVAYETHDWHRWITGQLSAREIVLNKCANCEAVEVREVGLDANIGGSRLDRRPLNRLLGWYTGHSPRRRRIL